MTNQKTVDLLLKVWELFGTVREGAAYLEKYPENEQMKADIAAGLRVLHNHLSAAAPLPQRAGKQGADPILSAFQSLAAGLEKGQPWNNSCKQKFGRTVLLLAERFSQALLEAVKPDTYLTHEEAQPIFAFCESAPHQCMELYQLIFALCEKAACSMPQESFDWTIRAMEEHPELLSGEGKPHPDYTYRPAPQRVFDRCPICGSEGSSYYRALSYRMSNFEYPHLPAKLWMKCGGCHNLYTWKYPEELLLQADHPGLVQPSPANALTAVRRESATILSIWSTILNKLRGYTSGQDLLEVGIGEGCLLAVALEMGYRPDAVEVVRQSAQEVADILQIPIWNGDFLDYHPDKRYSVIIMGDVIEHVTSPEQALRNAHDLLEDDGVLWLSTPNFEGSFTRMMKFRDPMWLEPYHISYFSFAGLRTLAEKCGFTVQEYQVSNRYNGSMELILTKSAHA